MPTTSQLDDSALVPILNQRVGDAVNAVDARDLHAALGVGRDFSNWIKGRLEELSLVIHEDFEVFAETGENGGRPRLQYAVSLDAAKHLAMAERNDRGREVRAYFITAEKSLRVKTNPALLRENRLAAKEERLGREQKLRVFRELKEIPSLTAEERRVICVKEAEIVGEPMPALLPKNEHADWITPTDIAVRVSSTANAVGRVITALKLKGDDGKGVEGLSEPKHNIAPGTNRSITTYVYSPTAVEQIVAHFASHRPS